MGYSILELVLRRLREANFHADIAYPGQKYPQITDTVATVHIEKVDRAGLTVTIEVNIICPGSMGGTVCEVEALRATEILRLAGAVCVQNGCSYDGVAQVYVVPVLATFTGSTEEDDCKLGPGFQVYIDEVRHPFVTRFFEEETSGIQAEYVTAQSAPAGISQGKRLWTIELEELIPVGAPEEEEITQIFVLKVESTLKTEVYAYCCWTSIQREFTREGLHRVRKGIAMDRLEEN